MKKKQGQSHHGTGGDHLACQGNRPELFDSYLCNNGRLGNGNAHRQPRHERWRWLQQIIHRLIVSFRFGFADRLPVAIVDRCLSRHRPASKRAKVGIAFAQSLASKRAKPHQPCPAGKTLRAKRAKSPPTLCSFARNQIGVSTHGQAVTLLVCSQGGSVEGDGGRMICWGGGIGWAGRRGATPKPSQLPTNSRPNAR